MSTYLIVHRAPADYVGSAKAATAWDAWFEDLGANLVDRGNAVFKRSTLGTSETDKPLGGYTLVTADDLDAAVALSNGCPLLQEGGGVEVGELRPVPGRHHPARVF
jgi:hypothetical protein